MHPRALVHLLSVVRALSSACGRIIAQPIRITGSLPCTGRANARGSSGTRSGKRSLITAGGVPAVSVVGHTTIAPLVFMASGVTHGDRSGAVSRKTLGRLGAP